MPSEQCRGGLPRPGALDAHEHPQHRRSGKFSTDRTMQDYNRDIWHLEPVAPLADN